MAEPVRARVYTVREARAVLPRVKLLMESIQATRAEIMALQPAVWPFLRGKATNGGNAQITALTEQFARLSSAVHQIMGMGILVKDLDKGIVDFLAVRQGRRVFLCWRHGEESIDYWHEMDAGFAGRQPIDESEFADRFDNPFEDNDT